MMCLNSERIKGVDHDALNANCPTSDDNCCGSVSRKTSGSLTAKTMVIKLQLAIIETLTKLEALNLE